MAACNMQYSHNGNSTSTDGLQTHSISSQSYNTDGARDPVKGKSTFCVSVSFGDCALILGWATSLAYGMGYVTGIHYISALHAAQDVAYDATKDPIMKRVLQMLGEG